MYNSIRLFVCTDRKNNVSSCAGILSIKACSYICVYKYVVLPCLHLTKGKKCCWLVRLPTILKYLRRTSLWGS